MTENKIKITTTMSSRMGEMLDEITEKMGLDYRQETVKYLISSFHNKINPSYVVKNKTKSEPDSLLKGTAICKKLKGENKKGVCTFYNYDGRERFEQKVDLENLTPEMIKNQYFPDKLSVERLQIEKKTNY